MQRILGFCNAPPEEKDYSILGSFAPQDATGKCVYCNHYENLAVKADACVRCGHCNSRCSFHVDQMARMQEIADYFANSKAGY